MLKPALRGRRKGSSKGLIPRVVYTRSIDVTNHVYARTPRSPVQWLTYMRLGVLASVWVLSYVLHDVLPDT